MPTRRGFRLVAKSSADTDTTDLLPNIGVPTLALWDDDDRRSPMDIAVVDAGGRLVVFPGGIPLVRDGEIVGAIGVSTGTVEQDQEVAEAGAAAF